LHSRNRKQNIDKTSRVGFTRPLMFLLCAGLALGCGGSGGGQTTEIPPPAQNLQVTLVEAGTGFALPVHVTHAGDGSGRLFVVEQAGVIRIIRNGRLLARPFLDVRSRVISGGEMGLLSVAFHPQYASNGRFFVNYTANSDSLRTVIAEYRVSDAPDVAGRAERVLLEIAQPYRNHNGGLNLFGPDGMLYIGMGDGGSGGDPHNNGQRLDTLLGKLLRLDVNGEAPYGVPRDNPFVVWGSPQVGRDILYADDFGRAVVAMLEAAHTKFDVFNIGSGRVTTVREVAELALRAAGHEPAKIVYDAASPTTVVHRMLDCAKARDLLGWTPETTPAEGIRRTVAWWRDNKDTWQR